MEPVIEPTTVWMVHLDRGTPDEIQGTLSADEWELVFTDAASPETARFPFVDIVSVKRVLGSPVFTVGWRRDDEARHTAFYLTRPPPLGTLGSPGGPRNTQDLTIATPFRRSGRCR
jgi:hypothetical protein